jgi:hypothetical protein
MIIAIETCFMLLEHCTRFACRRTPRSVGSRTLIRTAMMPITTSSSTSVNARASRGPRLRLAAATERPGDVSISAPR